VIRRVARQFHPEKVIRFFGSCARGTATEDRDVDLPALMAVEGSAFGKAAAISCALHDMRVARGVLVMTPERFEKRRDIVGTIAFEANEDGRVLYARSA